MMTRRVVSCGVLGLAVALLALGEARAAEQGISGRKLLLKANKHGKAKMVFLSKDPAIEGQSSTPQNGYLEVCSPAENEAGTLDLPAGGWRVNKKGISKYGATVLIKPGKTLKILGHLASDQSLGSVGVRLTIGDLVQCALFSGASVVRDDPRHFQGKDAPAPPDCSNATLGCPGSSPSSAFVD
jgi:hypothetical protein